MKKSNLTRPAVTRPLCPFCGKRFDNRGYSNHVNSCAQSHRSGEDLAVPAVREAQPR